MTTPMEAINKMSGKKIYVYYQNFDDEDVVFDISDYVQGFKETFKHSSVGDAYVGGGYQAVDIDMVNESKMFDTYEEFEEYYKDILYTIERYKIKCQIKYNGRVLSNIEELRDIYGYNKRSNK